MQIYINICVGPAQYYEWFYESKYYHFMSLIFETQVINYEKYVSQLEVVEFMSTKNPYWNDKFT